MILNKQYCVSQKITNIEADIHNYNFLKYIQYIYIYDNLRAYLLFIYVPNPLLRYSLSKIHVII